MLPLFTMLPMISVALTNATWLTLETRRSVVDYLMLSGTLRSAPADTTKTFPILNVNDGYVEGSEQFTIDLTNVTGVATTLGPANLATVTITDNDTTATDSAHDPLFLSNEFFVRMHYVDFLERELRTLRVC